MKLALAAGPADTRLVIRAEVATALAALFALLWLIAIARQALARWRASRTARRRAARATRGERAAAALLERLGYEIVERQPTILWRIAVDGEEVVVELRADLVVSQDGELYVAEVKTGEAAPLIGNAATRRQLLEYLVAYQVAGVLLVDVEAGRVSQVEFFSVPSSTLSEGRSVCA